MPRVLLVQYKKKLYLHYTRCFSWRCNQRNFTKYRY